MIHHGAAAAVADPRLVGHGVLGRAAACAVQPGAVRHEAQRPGHAEGTAGGRRRGGVQSPSMVDGSIARQNASSSLEAKMA